MRIAQIAPLGERVPPEKYGGTERVVSALTEELVKRGHQVTLFASGDSKTKARLASVYPTSLRHAKISNPYGTGKWSMFNIGLAYKMQQEFDIIHDHNEYLSLPSANISRTPVVMTLHGAIDQNCAKMYEELSAPYLVSISKKQQTFAPNLHYIGNVYHGLSMRHYPSKNEREKYMLFVGRISKEKGVHIAMDIANTLKRTLIIAAKTDEADKKYYYNYIQPRLTKYTKLIGEVDEKERNILMSKAYCFLHPVQWPEPFGLALIESAACGNPVIAFDNGAISEVVKDGVSGFVVNTKEEMIEAVKRIPSLNRRRARNYVLNTFTVEKMTDSYEAIYEQVLEEQQKYRSSEYEKDGRAITAYQSLLNKIYAD